MSAGEGTSETSSLIGLESINVNRNNPHPEMWTLPEEWNMEKRELYGVRQMIYNHKISLKSAMPFLLAMSNALCDPFDWLYAVEYRLY